MPSFKFQNINIFIKKFNLRLNNITVFLNAAYTKKAWVLLNQKYTFVSKKKLHYLEYK